MAGPAQVRPPLDSSEGRAVDHRSAGREDQRLHSEVERKDQERAIHDVDDQGAIEEIEEEEEPEARRGHVAPQVIGGEPASPTRVQSQRIRLLLCRQGMSGMCGHSQGVAPAPRRAWANASVV